MPCGKCFGGPFDGETLTDDRRERIVQYDPSPKSIYDFDPNTPGDEIVTLATGVYRFADGKGWVWSE